MPLCLFAVVVVSMCYQLLGALIKALSIKYFDREVPNFGLVWYKIGPVAVVDTSDMWLSSAWPQFAVSLAGVLANLLLAGLMAWYATYTTEAATAVFAFLAALFIYLQTLRSLDPLLNSDGYEMLCNITDSPHLRSIALKWLLREKGIEGMQHRQERFFWLSVLLYFCLVILVTQLLLGYLLYAIPGLSGLSHYVWLALIACCALELGLAIQFHKQTSLQRAA